MTLLLYFAGPSSGADSGSAVAAVLVVVALPATWLAAVQTLAQTASFSLVVLSCSNQFPSRSRSTISLSHLAFRNSTASFPLLLFLVSFTAHSPSSWLFLFFVCPILSSACLRISSPVALSFYFFSLAKLLFSLATFPLSMISSSNTSNSSCSGDIPEARISLFLSR